MSSAARVPISQRTAALSPLKSRLTLSLLWAGFLTLVVTGPWLMPGYLFGTDWPGPRRIPFPNDLPSFAPLQAGLSVASSVIGGETTGKLFICGFLFTAATLAFRAVPDASFAARAVASSIYVVNPFVYGRLHYGQLFLLAGYAVLPWVAASIRRLLLEPRPASSIVAGASLTVIGILSLHLFLASAVLAGALGVAHIVGAENRVAYLKRLVPSALLTAIGALALSSYWIIPLLSGRGSEGSKLFGIGASDLKVFATIPDPHLGLLPNLLGLYGFWAEASGRFTSMKAFVPGWPVILSLLLILCAIGAVDPLRKGNRQLSMWVIGLITAGAIALILEMGVSHPLTAGFVQWLDAHISPYRGMRDAGKWAAILALAYSQLAGLGAVAIFGWLRLRAPRPPRSEWLAGVTTGLVLALPLYYGNGLLYGAHGEIKPSQYPSGWYAADRALATDGHPGRALFLPWHLYMGYSFIQNENKVVAAPAPTFFSVPVLVSADPQVPGIAAPTDADQVAVSKLVTLGGQGHWSEVLKTLGVRYVLVAREVDWASFRYLDGQAGLVKVGDYGSIVLYRNDGPTQALAPPDRPSH